MFVVKPTPTPTNKYPSAMCRHCKPPPDAAMCWQAFTKKLKGGATWKKIFGELTSRWPEHIKTSPRVPDFINLCWGLK